MYLMLITQRSVVQIHPPQPTFINHLHRLVKIARERISFPCSVPFVSVSESLLLMLLSCSQAAVCRPPSYWLGVWFFVRNTIVVHGRPDVRVTHQLLLHTNRSSLVVEGCPVSMPEGIPIRDSGSNRSPFPVPCFPRHLLGQLTPRLDDAMTRPSMRNERHAGSDSNLPRRVTNRLSQGPTKHFNIRTS